MAHPYDNGDSSDEEIDIVMKRVAQQDRKNSDASENSSNRSSFFDAVFVDGEVPVAPRRRRFSKIFRKRRSSFTSVTYHSNESSSSLSTTSSNMNLTSALNLPLLDKDSKPHTLRSLLAHEGITVIIFIRHFWCGMCMSYVKQMAKLPFDRISKGDVKILMIGCGSPDLIEPYLEHNRIAVAAYTDPTRHLYQAMGLNESLSMGKDEEKGDYIKDSLSCIMFKSAVAGLKMPVKNPGSMKQLGGEFVFRVSRGQVECLFANRMMNSRNHASLKDVFAAANLDIRNATSVMDER